MMLVAVGIIWHSLLYKSQVVTSLAFPLAFCTVGIGHVLVFSLVAGLLLAVGLVYVSIRAHWYELEPARSQASISTVRSVVNGSHAETLSRHILLCEQNQSL
jgi:hypothetical protein